MVKSELIEKVAERSGLTLFKSEELIDLIFNSMTNTLSQGGRVEVRGFGAFSVQHRKQRVGRNPRTGESVSVEEKYIPRFKTGKELRLKLNSEKNASDNQREEN